ncbi:MAG: hypothetical protein DYH15_11255, partial [Nitrosomonas sp. PRO4]|nr:hypothetical protein [Nitrosomonas sp. PRO4]
MPFLRKLPINFCLKKFPVNGWLDIGSILLLALIYALLAKIIIENFAAHGIFSPIWPPSGLALAALLIGGRRLWPGIALGVFIANYLAGKSIESNLVFVIGNTFEPLFAIWLLKRNLKSANHQSIIDLKNPGEYSWFALAAILSVTLGTMICIMGLSLINELSSQVLTFSLLLWWIANLLGIAIFTPFFLIWKKLPEGWFAGYRAIETMAFIGLTILTGQVIFLEWCYDELGFIARDYWVIVFVTWGAIRFGRHGITLVLTIAFVQAMIGTASGIGYFGRDLQEYGVINMQLAFLIV